MKTTLELPDPLVRAVKVRAAATDRRIKDVVAELIERGLRDTAPGGEAPLDLVDYIGKWPHYSTIEEVVDHVRDLRKDRDEA